MSYLDLSISEIHQALVDKKVTVLDLVKESLERAKKDTNNAFEYICEKEALEEASKLTEIEEDNLLFGIPYVLKDNFSTKGITTTGSSNILKGYVPVFDSTVYKKLHDAHAILIAKATLDELAMGGTGTTGHLGITHNPYSKERLCGGSSCGSAVAVAAGIVPFAIGSDTGDSVRKPASYTGLVGFKPTWGRISRFGLFPFAPSMDHVAYFTKNVEDSEILLSCLAGRDELDSTSSTKEVLNYKLEAHKVDAKSKKLAIVEEIYDSITDKDVKNEFDSLVKKLENEGMKVEKVHINMNLLNAIYGTYFIISCAEAGSNNANLDGIKFGNRIEGESYEDLVKKTRTAGFSPLIKRRFLIGSFSLMSENQDELFRRAQKSRRLIVNAFNNVLKDYDAIILPAAPSITPKFDDSSDKLSNEYLLADNYLAFGNFAGLPSITVPLGFKENMPYGINITGRIFEEAEVFSIAKNIEDLQGFSNITVLNYKEKEGK